MKINHYCIVNEGRICIDIQDVILYLYKIKGSTTNIKQIIEFYEDLAEKARVRNQI